MERVARIVEDKERRLAARRCVRCWHPACICSNLRPLPIASEVRVFVLCHWREFGNAGDDAKLLCAADDRSELFVYGRRGDCERLVEALEPFEHAVLLFPDAKALSVAEASGSRKRPLAVVVVDAPWTLARKMAKRLDALREIPHVKLDTDLVSAYARAQSQPGRVCTLEAIGLFLSAVGETQALDACRHLVHLNNTALKGVPSSELYDVRGDHKGHPAWYFGETLLISRRRLNSLN
ncbi:hypothetical protein CTAYLR_006249 [Chrysophaeum taylorii]|uniref:tRNA-uridine aminocarboxypropyltransferase n=1 Tax=Chrysophaeum taylorii TaxID=2483200 RepID=A0AAD7UHQ0_9STRA|nr:hypothetical protein CTAYLR_006249 [Chrysophaeum taylorii]